MLQKDSVHFCEWLLILLMLIQPSEGKRCLNRESIGYRENNFHNCDHPVYSECCERDKRFTCCEPLLTKNLREQLQLWGMVAAMAAVGAMVYTCLIKDKDMVRSDTLKQAVNRLGQRLGIRPAQSESGDRFTTINQPSSALQQHQQYQQQHQQQQRSQLLHLNFKDQRSPPSIVNATSTGAYTALPRHFYHDV